MNTKDKKFEKLIWDAYHERDSYDSLRHQLLRVREIMCSSHKEFSDLSAISQFDQCVTIGCIALQSTRKGLSKLSIISKNKDEVFEYAVDEGYVPPSKIEISVRKLLE